MLRRVRLAEQTHTEPQSHHQFYHAANVRNAFRRRPTAFGEPVISNGERRRDFHGPAVCFRSLAVKRRPLRDNRHQVTMPASRGNRRFRRANTATDAAVTRSRLLQPRVCASKSSIRRPPGSRRDRRSAANHAVPRRQAAPRRTTIRRADPTLDQAVVGVRARGTKASARRTSPRGDLTNPWPSGPRAETCSRATVRPTTSLLRRDSKAVRLATGSSWRRRVLKPHTSS